MFTKFIWNHKIKFSILAFIISWYIYHGHYSDQAIKYKNFEKIDIGMDSNQVNKIMGKAEFRRPYTDDEHLFQYSYKKDVGFLVSMVVDFDTTYRVQMKWVY